MDCYNIYFSATNNSKKVVNEFSNRFNIIKEYNLADKLSIDIKFKEEDITVFGVPSFGGRVPNIALDRLKDIDGNNSLAVLIVTYGNRDYEDTLIELFDFLKERHFRIIALISFVCRHSIINEFARFRPNTKDLNELDYFSQKVIAKIRNNNFSEPSVPGKRPYKELKVAKLEILVNDNCNKCNYCETICLTNAIISYKNIDKNKCISCMRCVNACPNNARYVETKVKENLKNKIKDDCLIEKENELFI